MVQIIDNNGRLVLVVNGAIVGEVVGIQSDADQAKVDEEPWWKPSDEFPATHPPLRLLPAK